MTCTIGYVDGSVVIIASDSAAVADSSYTIRKGHTKVWNGPHMIIGYAGDFAVCQWIRYVFEWPLMKNVDYEGLMEYLVKASHLIDEGLKKRFTSVQDWQLMIGCPETRRRSASLFVMYANGDIEASAEPYAVIGSASACALGSLYATKEDSTKTSWDHIQIALEAAAANDVYIKRPWQVLYT